eukprot:1152555-Amorphochlora_amoeboformis.AAC.3
MTGLMVTIIFAVLFCNDHYKRVMDAWDEAADSSGTSNTRGRDKVAMGFWVANFGGNVHAVEAEAAEYYLNYLGPWDDKNLPPERDEDGNIVEKRDSQGYIIKPKVRKPGPGEVWWKNL